MPEDTREIVKDEVIKYLGQQLGLHVGPVKETPRDNAKPIEWPRKIELYHGEPPSFDGKIPIEFPLTEKCGVEMKDKEGKSLGHCNLPLRVTRRKNNKFAWDDNNAGGQLEYDDKDVRQYKYCSSHGPFPVGPDKW